jgi:integrase/recombinase XerD
MAYQKRKIASKEKILFPGVLTFQALFGQVKAAKKKPSSRSQSKRPRRKPRAKSQPKPSFFGGVMRLVASFVAPSQPKKRQPKPQSETKEDPTQERQEVVPVEPTVVPSLAQATTSRPEFLLTQHLVDQKEQLKSSIESFLLDQRSEHTRRSYGKDLKRFVDFLRLRQMGLGIQTINRSLIISYKDYLLADDLKDTTVDRHLACLRSFFQWLVDDGVIEKNPALGVRFLSPKRISPTNGFTDEQVAAMLRQPNLHLRSGAMHYAILMVLFYCGLRRSECCSLCFEDILTERGQKVLRVKGKGNAERLIVLLPAVFHAIEYYVMIANRTKNPEDPVFTPVRNHRTGVLLKPLDPSMIFYIVTRYAKKAEIHQRVSPHSCRATAISNARDHRVSDRAIQQFAGWTSLEMITRYDKRKVAIEDSAAFGIYYGLEPVSEQSQSLAPQPEQSLNN